MFVDDVRVSVSYADGRAFLHSVQLFVHGDKFDATELVTDYALGYAVDRTTIVASSFADDFDGVNF